MKDKFLKKRRRSEQLSEVEKLLEYLMGTVIYGTD